MSAAEQSNDHGSALRLLAARWVVRRDRGLSAAEAIEFELWLAADPRHTAAFEQATGAWGRLDRVPEFAAQAELAATAGARRRRRRTATLGWLGAAAALVLAGILWWPPPGGSEEQRGPALLAAGPRMITLADGTLVRLNAGSEVAEEFDATERRVRLARGEAHFTVVKDARRPFVVVAGALRVQAVGTAFNVHLHAARVEVLVTEGRVQLDLDDAGAAPEPFLDAGQRALVPLRTVSVSTPPEIVVTRVEPAEISRALAWHDSLVRLGGATLAELAAEFERRFGQRVEFAQPEIAELRAGGRVRADDAEGFARLLGTTFDLDVERTADGAWRLRKKFAATDSGK